MLWERATVAVAMVAIAVMAAIMPAIKSPTNLFSLTNNDFYFFDIISIMIPWFCEICRYQDMGALFYYK
jgi:hypothetical protein